jgi:hypothetical protein
MRTKKTYMINHIPIKQMWLKKEIILIKDVQKWVDQKMLNNPMKKRLFIIYQRTKIEKVVVQKMKGLKEPNILYKVETLNHITIYNVLFSFVSNCRFYNLCCMTNNVQMVTLCLNTNCSCNKLFLCCALNPINTPKPLN